MSWIFYVIFFALVIISASIFGSLYSRQEAKEIKKEIESDISVDQMKKLEENLTAFLSKNNLSTNSSLDEISRVLKINIGKEVDIPTQADLSMPDRNGQRWVTFKYGLSNQKRIFAFAHECGHLINGDEGHHTRPDGKNKPTVDQLADYTAAAILLPMQDLKAFLEERNYKNLKKSKKLSIIKELCERYNVEDILVVRRIREIYSIN